MAIDLLAPFVPCIKIDKGSIVYINELYLPKNWDNFQKELELRYPDKLKFIIPEVQNDDDSIWQNDIPQGPNLNEILYEGYKQVVDEIKKNDPQPEPAPH